MELKNFKFKDKACDNCPHLLTPEKLSPYAGAYEELQCVLERIRNECFPNPHPCHKHDGTFCAIAVKEINPTPLRINNCSPLPAKGAGKGLVPLAQKQLENYNSEKSENCGVKS